MNQLLKELPRTLKQYNNSVLLPIDILTGKEFRRLKRKKKKI